MTRRLADVEPHPTNHGRRAVPFDSGGVGEVVLSELLGSGGFASVWRVQAAEEVRPSFKLT